MVCEEVHIVHTPVDLLWQGFMCTRALPLCVKWIMPCC